MYVQNNPHKIHQNRSLSFTENQSKFNNNQLNQFIKEQLFELKRKRKLPSLIQQESDYLMDEINKINNIYKIPIIKTQHAIPKISQLQNSKQNSVNKLKPSIILSENRPYRLRTYLKQTQPIIKINNIIIKNEDPCQY
ncbi:unnamed protein product [Paramecium primaurelia]|uniref:Uncharacterized protein n=1 Tax=Paramecium primaurelia TaxID=5886 RepID=A0A8S1LBQ4_PARPR|nr:unnamed protein product [Paramecium primaurelia]